MGTHKDGTCIKITCSVSMRFFCEPFAKKNAKELVAGQKAGINHVLDGYN